MSKRKPIDKQQARQRRDRMLDAAAATELSLTEGVREMRAIAGMTQEEFARHRGVSARVIKALELGQGNPTVATLNRIGEFFGLEVAFVPRRQVASAAAHGADRGRLDPVDGMMGLGDLLPMLAEVSSKLENIERLNQRLEDNVVDLANRLSQGRADDQGLTAPAQPGSPRRRRP